MTFSTDSSTINHEYMTVASSLEEMEVTQQSARQLECLQEVKDTAGNLVSEALNLPNDLDLITLSQPHYAIFDTGVGFDEIRNRYDPNNPPFGWSVQFSGEQSIIFTRVEDQCSVRLDYNAGQGPTPTTVILEVEPAYLQAKELFAAAEGSGDSEVVVQSATNATITEVGTLEEALDKYVNSYLTSGWILNETLTDERVDSAFITLERGNYQLHIIGEAGVGRVFLRFQTRIASCGPSFSVTN